MPVWLELQALYGLSWNSLSTNRLHVLQRSNTSTNAELFVHEQRTHWDTNSLLRWIFPELIPQSKDVWTDSRVWINRAVTRLEDSVVVNLDYRTDALGTGGSAVSRHYDAIIDDDLVDEDEADSETQMEKVIREHKRSESLFVETAKGRHWLIGTRWAFHDLISHVCENEPDVDRYWRPAEDRSDSTRTLPIDYHGRTYYVGEPIFPERFSREELVRIAHKQGPYIYSCFYLLYPVPEEEQVFQPAWIQNWTVLPKITQPVFCTDPAISQKSTADYSGIAGVGLTDRGPDQGYDIYIVHAKRARLLPNDLIHEMYELTRTWHPKLFGFEDQGFQRAYQYPIQLLRSQYPVPIPLTMVRWPGSMAKQQKAGNSKFARIRAMQPYFASGMVYLGPGQEDLRRELLQFPHGEHDDLLDALAYAIFLAIPEGGVVTEIEAARSDFDWDEGIVDGVCVLRADSILDEIESGPALPELESLADKAWRGY